MLSPAWQYDGRNGSRGGESYGICSYGLAARQLAAGTAGCADDPEGQGHRWAGHAGDAYGLRSGVWIDRRRGVGIVYYVTGLPAELPPGKSSFSLPEEQAFRRAAALIGR
jgi:hypothetical protein